MLDQQPEKVKGNPLRRFYIQLEMFFSTRPILFALLATLLGSAVAIVPIRDMARAEYTVQGYTFILISIATFLVVAGIIQIWFWLRNSVKRQMVIQLEMLLIRLSDENIIVDTYKLKYFPNHCKDCYRDYVMITAILIARFDKKIDYLFPPRLAPVVPDNDWLPFDQVSQLTSDIKALIHYLKNK